jgi:hypothetical protein
MRTLVPLAALALVACGYSEEKFAEDRATKTCEAYAECMGEECPAGSDFGMVEGCEFDPQAARDCIAAEWTCTEPVSGFSFPLPPDVCNNVWVCPETSESAGTTEATEI